jgi:outer membrane protein W
MKVIFLTVFTLIGIAAYSQDTQISRKGFVIGASVGVSNSNIRISTKSQNNTDLGLNWKVGYMIKPNLALLLNGSASIYDYNLSGRERKRDFGGIFPSAQYWVADKFWILGGVGIGTDAPVFYDLKPENEEETKYHSGIGAISSVGYEIYRKKNFVLDLQARLNFSSVDLPLGKANGFNTALLLGFNFY